MGGGGLTRSNSFKTWREGQGGVRPGLEAEVQRQTIQPQFLRWRRCLPSHSFFFASAPPTSSSSAVLSQCSALAGSSASASLSFPPLRALEEDGSAEPPTGQEPACERVRANSGPGRRCGPRSRCGPGARARPAALRAWASPPRAPRCLTRAAANRGVQPGRHVTGEAALFPSAARGRKGAAPRAGERSGRGGGGGRRERRRRHRLRANRARILGALR